MQQINRHLDEASRPSDWLPKAYHRFSIRFTRPTSVITAIVYDRAQRVHEVEGKTTAEVCAKAKCWIDKQLRADAAKT